MPFCIDIHTHRAEPECIGIRNIRLSGSDPVWPAGDYFSAGIHPWDAAAAQEKWLEIFTRDDLPRLLAVGETGLDLRPEFAPQAVQMRWLERQIDLANRIGKPLIIHNVRATPVLQPLLRAEALVPVVLHSFTGAPEQARQWVDTVPAVRFSFGPSVLRSPKTQAALRWIASEHPDRLFLETDDTPSLSIRTLYAFAADRTGWDDTQLKERIAQNFNDLFPKILPA